MIRFVRQDFERLQGYLENYSLSADLGAKAREELLKRAHKHCLAALQVRAVLEVEATSGGLTLSGTVVPSGSEQLAQISESFSDVVGALFASVHGLYKPAFMSLRSSIETLVRGTAGLTSNEARTTTSVYRLFELAAQQPSFQPPSTTYFTELNQQYGQLCLFTHSATPAHMAGTYALATFPRHDTGQLRVFVRRLEQILVASLAVLIHANRDLYLKVPPRARELLDEVLPTTVRIRALGG